MSGAIRLLLIADDERDVARLEGAVTARAGASFDVRQVRDLAGALQ
jgi:hypothetical protein